LETFRRILRVLPLLAAAASPAASDTPRIVRDPVRVTWASHPIVRFKSVAGQRVNWCLRGYVPPFQDFAFEKSSTNRGDSQALHFVVPLVRPGSYQIRVATRSQRTGSFAGEVVAHIVVLPPVGYALDTGNGSISSTTGAASQNLDFGVAYGAKPPGLPGSSERAGTAPRCSEHRADR
jgi:hypothetical protein